MNYLKTKLMNLKNIRILPLFLILLFVVNESIFAQQGEINEIEKIGNHLSELLIKRGNISESPFAINIERLFPEEDFSKYEDSPAGFILNMLYGSQLFLPETWSELLIEADSLNVNKKAKYYKTYYNEGTKDSFTLTCVLKQSSKYYAFSAVVLGWEDDKYVMRIYKKMKEYNNIKELENNLYSIAIEEEMEELKELNEDSEH
jgi:hypothetical protein